MKKSKKILIPVSIVVVLIAIVLVVVMMNRGHRVIKVESVEGEVELDRGSAVKEVFKDMNLRSEDMVTTGEDGLLELRADEDKYIVAIENTCFEIVSKGNAKEGRLKIKLKYGTSLIEIENKLPEGASFEVETPNAALSVRGTTFEVTYIPETNTTILKVTDGLVEAETDTESQMVPAGSTAVITDEHIVLASEDSMAGVVMPVMPEGNGGNGTPGGDSYISPIDKVYIQEDEWPDLLKGGSDKEQLEDMLAIAKMCKDAGNEDYLNVALRQMCYTISSAGLYQPMEENRASAQYIYDIPTLNETFSFLTDEKIGEEHLYLDSYIDGDKLVCVYPDDVSLQEIASVYVLSAYYGENNEIIIEDCSYRWTPLSTFEDVISTITVHLIQDETGKYIFGYIE